MGAVQIKTSAYLLPDEPAQHEQFQWLAKQIRDYGGDSTLVRAQEIEGLTREKVVSLFNAARDKEYVDLKKALQAFIERRRKSDADFAAAEQKRLPSTCWTPNSRITAIAARLRRSSSVLSSQTKPSGRSAK